MALIKVGNFSQDITNFDPANDKLDFGNISVHSLILGQEPDGTATIVYPWQPNQFQRILGANGQGIQWSDLSESNFAPVGNEHLRGDIGGVFSWENKIGPAFDPANTQRANTVYIRSHERDKVTVVEDFDPLTDKINFLYFGTRERLSVENEGNNLVISSEPIGQRFVFEGVQKEQLIGANLEFHFDQIQEDLLDRAFGFQPEQLSLVNRTMLFTPEGGPTDGSQTRTGSFVTASGEAPGQPRTLEESTRQIQQRAEQQEQSQQDSPVEDMPMDMDMDMDMDMPMDMDLPMDMDVDMQTDMDMAPPDLTRVVMNLPGGSNVHNSCLQLAVDGSLFWGGGIGGSLTVKNPMGFAIDDWEVSFLTPHDQFQSWSADVMVEDAGGGLNRVTFTPADWNGSIPANGEIVLSFNAQGVDLPDRGEVNRENFFAPSLSAQPMNMGMSMGTTMGSQAPDLITGQSMAGSRAVRRDRPELTEDGNGYAINDGGDLITLVRRSGQVLSENTSSRWDFLAVKQTRSGDFKVLAEGEGVRDGQFRLFRFDADGQLSGKKRWFSEEKAINRGLDTRFNVDFDGDDLVMGMTDRSSSGMPMGDQAPLV